MLGAFLLFGAITAGGQTATGIHLVDVRFDGDTHLKGVELKKCAADLRSREYEGTGWLASLAERVRDFLQESGYFKALVTPSAEQLPDKHLTHQFIARFHIEAGEQYRIGDIAFENNHVFSTRELRSMFNVASGDIFRPAKLRQGIARMRDAYIAGGYPNFTPVPDTNIDDSRNVINVAIYVDEGRHSP